MIQTVGSDLSNTKPLQRHTGSKAAIERQRLSVVSVTILSPRLNNASGAAAGRRDCLKMGTPLSVMAKSTLISINFQLLGGW